MSTCLIVFHALEKPKAHVTYVCIDEQQQRHLSVAATAVTDCELAVSCRQEQRLFQLIKTNSVS